VGGKGEVAGLIDGFGVAVSTAGGELLAPVATVGEIGLEQVDGVFGGVSPLDFIDILPALKRRGF
jgi:hypothetical protein